MTTQNNHTTPAPNSSLKANKPGKNHFLDKTYLTVPLIPIPGESNAAYKAAIVLVAEIDRRLERGEHCRLNGKLCTTLDQAVDALLDQITT